MDFHDFSNTPVPTNEWFDNYSGDDLAFHVFTDYGYGRWQLPVSDLIPGDEIVVTGDMQVLWENERYLDEPGMDFESLRKSRTVFKVTGSWTSYAGLEPGEISVELTLGDQDLDFDGRPVEVSYVNLRLRQDQIVTVMPSEPQVLDPTTLRPMRNWVNVYGVDQAYGGPEEGGWYYNTYEPLMHVPCASYEQAQEVSEKLSEMFPRTGKSSLVLGGADFSVRIENCKGEYEPAERPYYS